MRKIIAAAAVGGALSLVLLTPGAAHAGDSDGNPKRDVTIKTGTAKVVRAEFFENKDHTGKWFKTLGSDNCSASTSDIDMHLSNVGYDLSGAATGWNDDISWAADYSKCDVKLWKDAGWSGEALGFKNWGNGSYVGDAHNDWATSYALS